MPRTLAPKTQDWLSDLPPFYAEDPFIHATLDAMAREFQRIEDVAGQLLLEAFPQNSTDELSLLSLWEIQLGVGTDTSATDEDRRQALRSAIAQRRASSEQSWYEAMSAVVGSTLWTYSVASGVVTINLPYDTSSPAAQRVRVRARALTPAHLVLAFVYGEGFILDESAFDAGTF